MGDVAGKGVPAALLVAKLSSEARFCLLTESDPAKAIQMLNDQMIRGGLGDRFVTLAATIIDPKAHKITIINAGHMSPRVLCAATGELSDAITIEATGLPLGIMPEYEYESVTLDLEVGDTLAIFTDGVTDSMSPSGELFGAEGVDRYLIAEGDAATETTRPKRVGERMIQAVRRHANGRPQNDDIALVCFGRVPPGSGPVTTAARMQK